MTSVHLPKVLPDLWLADQQLAPGILHRLGSSGERTDEPPHLFFGDGRAKWSFLQPALVDGFSLVLSQGGQSGIRTPCEGTITVLHRPFGFPRLDEAGQSQLR